jgi:hypothetical protein
MSSVFPALALEGEEKGRRITMRETQNEAAILPHAIVAIVRRGASLVHVDVVNAASRQKAEIFVRFVRLGPQDLPNAKSSAPPVSLTVAKALLNSVSSASVRPVNSCFRRG